MESSWRANTWQQGLSSLWEDSGLARPPATTLCAYVLTGPYAGNWVLNWHVDTFCLMAYVPPDMETPYAIEYVQVLTVGPNFPYGYPVDADVPM